MASRAERVESELVSLADWIERYFASRDLRLPPAIAAGVASARAALALPAVFGLVHGLGHARHPLVPLGDTNLKRHVPRPQPGVAKALGVMLRAAQPATQKPA